MKRYLLLFSLLFIYACSDKNSDSKNNANSNSFTELGQVTFEIDSLSDFNFPEFQLIQEAGEEFLLVMNRVNFSFDYYDLESGQMAKRTTIQREEKFPIRSLYGFWYHNADSIFLFNQMSLNGISLLDGDGNILTQFSPQKVDRSSPQTMMKSMVNHYSRATNASYYEDGRLYFSNMSMNGFLKSEEERVDFHPSVEVDLIDNEVVWNENIKVPDFYKGKVWPMEMGNFSRIKQSDKLIYSWSGMDSLLVYDQELKTIEAVNAKSEFAQALNYTSGSNLPKDVMLRERISQITYNSILYDPNREVYYRFVTIGRDMDDSDLEDQFPYLKNDFSIIVLDKEFNMLAEKRLPGKIHYPYKSFVGEKGLYLSRTNPFYEDLNEDEVIFDIYRFD